MTTGSFVPQPFALPAATHSYLERAAESLREAITSTEVPLRYAHAHVSALRATAALLAARAHPNGPRRGRGAQRNAWVLLAEVAPDRRSPRSSCRGPRRARSRGGAAGASR